MRMLGLWLSLAVVWPYTGLAALTYQDRPVSGSDQVERQVFDDEAEVARLVLDGDGNVLRSEGKVPDGTAECRDDEGSLRGRVTFQGGVLAGPAVIFNADGTLHLETNYAANRLHGPYRLFDAQGRLKTEHHFLDGRQDGEQKVFYDSGQVMSRSRYSYGVKDGPIIMYYENGRVAYKSFYHQGHQLGKVEYDQEGRELKQQGTLVPPGPVADNTAGLTPEATGSGTFAPEPQPALSGPAPGHWQGRLVVFGNLPTSTFAMGNVNAYLDEWDEYLIFTGRDSSLGLVSLSTMTGGVGYWISEAVFAGVEGELLSSETSAGDRQLGVTFRIQALELGGFVQVATHLPPHVFMAGLGGYAVSLIDAWEYLYLAEAGYNDAFRVFHGSAFGFKLMAGYQVELSPFFGVGVDLGYRLASVGNPTFTAARYRDEAFENNGSPVAFDFSGFFVRAGFRLYFQAR